jgi:hypothetical protein
MSAGDAPPRQDEYEQKYMAGGQAMAHSRMRMPAWFHWLMLLLGGVSAVSVTAATIASGGAAAFGYLSVLMCLAVWLLFSHVRCTVTKEQVHVQFGLFGPKIAIPDVISAVVEKYDWKKYGGWGIRMSSDRTWAYSVPGGKGIGVCITYRAGAGDKRKERKVFISADNAEELVSAIQLAQGGSSATQARIETPPDEAELAAAQAEAEAVLADENRRTS